MEAAERLALTAFCAESAGLRAELAHLPPERRRLFEVVEREAAARRPILALLERLLGTGREETVRSFATALLGTGPGRADEERYGCPDGTCDRLCVPEPAGAVPRCGVLDRPLKRV